MGQSLSNPLSGNFLQYHIDIYIIRSISYGPYGMIIPEQKIEYQCQNVEALLRQIVIVTFNIIIYLLTTYVFCHCHVRWNICSKIDGPNMSDEKPANSIMQGFDSGKPQLPPVHR